MIKINILLFLFFLNLHGMLLPMDLILRTASLDDLIGIKELYEDIAETSDGIARIKSEISEDHIKTIIESSLSKGFILVAEIILNDKKKIIGEIHGSRFGLTKMPHVISNVGLVVHSSYRSIGVGRILLEKFLADIESNYSDILRVELGVFSSNKIAYDFYKKVGFVEEGCLKNRIIQPNGITDDQILMVWFNPKFKCNIKS